MTTPVTSIYSQFKDLDGQPLENGYIYVGTANQNPETAPLAVYYDEASTQPAAQPLRTINGFIHRSGTPTNVFVATDYSITVRNQQRELVFTEPSASSSGGGQNVTGSSTFNLINAGDEFTITTLEGDTFVIDEEGNVTITIAEGDTFLVTGEGDTIFQTDVIMDGNTTTFINGATIDLPDNTVTINDLSEEVLNLIFTSVGGAGGSGISSGDGRLSLATGVKVMTTDYTAITTVYYVGSVIILLNDGTGSFLPFTIGELSQTLADATKSPSAAAANSNYDIFGWQDEMSVTGISRTGTTATATTSAAHGITTGAVVLIAGAAQSQYNGFQTLLSGSGSTFTFTVTGSPVSPATGTITATTGRISRGPAWTSAVVRGAGAGTTEIELIGNSYVNAVAITNGPAENMGTYLGTIHTNAAAATLDWKLGSVAAGGGEAWLGVWNVSNRVTVPLAVLTNTVSWTYNSSVARSVAASNTFRASFVRGLNDTLSRTQYMSACEPQAGSGACLIGLDSTSLQAADSVIGNFAPGINTPINAQITAVYRGYPGLGFHFIQALELAALNGPVIFYGMSTGYTAVPAYSSALFVEIEA